MGGIIELVTHHRPAGSLERHLERTDSLPAARAHRPRPAEAVLALCGHEGCEACDVPQPCPGHQAIDDLLAVVPGAEAYVLAALGKSSPGDAALALLGAASRDLAAIETAEGLVAAIPQLALAVGHGTAAALARVRADGEVETLARGGAAFDAAPRRIEALAREALDGAGGPPAPEARRSVRRDGRLAAVALAQDADRLVLVLEQAEPAAWNRLGTHEGDRLAVYGALAHAALVGARGRAGLREASARAAATLAAVRDGVIAVDRDGVVCALNQAAAAVLGVRREEVVGRRLSELPRLAGLGFALSAPADQGAEVVVALARGEVAVRARAHEGGVVAALRDLAAEQSNARRLVGSVARYSFGDLIGASPGFQAILEEARRAAGCDVPVLVGGESGTGKEMLAQAIHNASPRAAEPFLGINVTAIPRELLESELFGYEGGTFTGARTGGRAGKFELAGGGTLLLDEIGDMPLEMQGKLLRVLQERVVQRLGSARDIQVRARIIATTSRDLAEAVEQGRFRLDLYHRLRVLQLRMPPLRERTGDVPRLVADELRRHAERTQRRVSVAPQVMEALEAHDWPGNVRELRNVLEGEISVLGPGETVLTRVPPVLRQPGRAPRPSAAESTGILPLVELERQACARALAACDGNVARAARALGVAKGTLYAKMKRYGIEPPPPAPRRA
jgi:transcriptional regulator with PAS, ATPase and Fis domain